MLCDDLDNFDDRIRMVKVRKLNVLDEEGKAKESPEISLSYLFRVVTITMNIMK